MTIEMILTVLVGMFAFLALSATLRLREVQKKLLNMTYKERQSRRDAKYWEASWESLWWSYRQLTTIDDGPDTDAVFGDTSFVVGGSDSTPPDSWKVLTP